MIINVQIHQEDFSAAAGYKTEIDDAFSRAFAPMKTCSTEYLMLGEHTAASDAAVEVIVKMREGVAEDLAAQLTRVLVDAMKAHDTHNGYKVKL